MSYPDLKGNTYIVTGAASGLGRCTSTLLTQQGANVALIDLHKPQHVLEEVEKLGGRGLAFSCDVQDPDALEAVMKEVVQHFGSIHGAANMAGILGTQGIKGTDYAVDRVPDGEWDKILGVNLNGVKNSMRAELRHMKDGGALVNAGSVAGQLGLPYMAPYCASKWAVLGLTKVAAQESGSRGIRINAVAPGVIRTPMTQAGATDEELYDRLGSRTALKRLGEPEEIARVITFLLSKEASYITGAVINIDGGFF
ncbi:uncharacterized protein PV07_02214 [Cladophialophora immunda]|uniref:Ketoreductase domain-containing protein n=1 Tax=Cladophialophora immunda TaxID=569365 RepID=A0A0D2DIM9_9EURO|nr:uncharacterized protein PV07_02214 [Cladophialophora immunda]KIW35524.1 hypothetical protein PV07_02214 [Cladophialophora immunda]OQV09730.1 hypothetical protein CLAIMM_13820 [Cladophialophora immunda]